VSEIAALDSQIERLEKRAADLERKVLTSPASPEGVEANDAWNLAQKEIGRLRERRIHVAAGLPDPAAVPEPTKTVAAARPIIRMPARMSDKAGPEGRKAVHVEPPLSRTLLDELSALTEKYWEADAIGRVEDNIQKVIDHFCDQKANSERLFTQAPYCGLVKVLAELDTQIGAIAEFQMRRRHGIEARLDALEAQPKMKYCGVWAADKAHAAGSFTTYDGALWHANVDAAGILPGDGKIWTLAVKRGRDARERAAR
jgi:hypothetical protein